jgi:hypothetical protein
VAAQEVGALSLIAQLGIADAPSVKAEHPVWIDRSEVLRAAATGLWWPAGGCRHVIGRVLDPFGHVLQEVRSPFAGEILYVVATPPVTEGEPVGFVGHVADSEPRP